MVRPECSVCGAAADGQPLRRCRYCGRVHCSAHQLPEQHGCTGLAGDGVAAPGANPELLADPGTAGASERADGGDVSAEPNARSPDSTVLSRAEGSAPARSAGADRNTSLTGVLLSILGVPVTLLRHYKLAVLVLLLVGASIAYGPIRTADVVGDRGRPVDDAIVDAGDRLEAVAANVSADLEETVDDSTFGDIDFRRPQPGDGASPGESTTGSGTGPSPTASESTAFEREVERAVHERVNEERTSRGLEPIAFDDRLAEIARYHSQDMAENDYFAHTAPDGETMGDRYDAFSYDCRVPAGTTFLTGGENIFRVTYRGSAASAETVADQAVTGWLNSPPHRENLLRPAWRNEGIGVDAVREDGEVHIYVTQNFC